jgi:hypothetical protein
VSSADADALDDPLVERAPGAGFIEVIDGSGELLVRQGNPGEIAPGADDRFRHPISSQQGRPAAQPTNRLLVKAINPCCQVVQFVPGNRDMASVSGKELAHDVERCLHELQRCRCEARDVTEK